MKKKKEITHIRCLNIVKKTVTQAVKALEMQFFVHIYRGIPILGYKDTSPIERYKPLH